MAFPAIESINPTVDSATGGAAGSGSTASTIHNWNWPTPVSAGSLLIAFARVAAAGAVSVTGGSFTIAAQDSSDGSDDVTLWGYQPTMADGSEDGAAVQFTHGSGKIAVVSMSITGAADITVRTPESSTVAVGTNTTPDPTTCTPTGGAKDYLWVWFGGWDGEQTLSKSPPTNFNDEPDVSTGTGGAVATNCQIKTPDRQFNGASLDAGSITLSGAPNAGWTAWLIAVHPAAAAALPITRSPWPALQAVNRAGTF